MEPIRKTPISDIVTFFFGSLLTTITYLEQAANKITEDVITEVEKYIGISQVQSSKRR